MATSQTSEPQPQPPPVTNAAAPQITPVVETRRVEVTIGRRTLLGLLAALALVALALLSLGTLISILLAAVLAFGLDPVVGALVVRGWGRGRAALVVFAGLFVSVFA